MRFENLLFDADDTLFSFSLADRDAFGALCAANDIPNTPETRALYGEINGELWAALERGEVSKEFVVTERFVRFLRRLGLKRDVEKCSCEYLECLGAGVYLLPGAEEVCRSLSRDHRLYLITNAVASVQHSRLSRSPLAPYITAAFVSEDVGAAKPDPAYFSYVLGHIPGADRDNCLVIGDSPASDLLGANRSGLPCCWYNPGGLSRPTGLRIDCEIRDLRELPGLV